MKALCWTMWGLVAAGLGSFGAEERFTEERFIVAPLAERPVAGREVLMVVTDSQRFALAAPLGWRVFQDETARSVTLRREESTLTIKFGRGSATHAGEDAEENWLEELRREYSGAEVLDRPVLRAFSREAMSFDLRWTHAGEFQRMGRFARVALKTGAVDFGLVCPPEVFETHLSTMMQLMATMRSAGADERLEIRTLAVE